MLYLEFYSQYVHRYIKDNNISGVEEIYTFIVLECQATDTRHGTPPNQCL